MNKLQQRSAQIFSILKETNPKPTTELNYNSEFELLVAVVLSAQATDVSVNKATAKLYPIANTPEAIYALGEEGLMEYIKTIGLYKSKAKNVIGLCKMLIEEHKSIVPRDFDALIKLPGVGRKTANVVLNTLFGEKRIAVDTHIFRLGNRLGIAKGKTPLDVELKLYKAVPDEYMLDAHHWLILHGRYICTARNPKCHNCTITDYCEYYLKNNKVVKPK